MKAVYTELHRSHDPQFFLVRGVIQRTTEQPERADRLLAGLKAGKHDLVAPTIFGQGPRARVHSPEYLRFLEEAWDAWKALGDSGPEMIANMHPVRYAATYPTHIVGRLGWHTIDTSCPIGPGTWAAACAATDVAPRLPSLSWTVKTQPRPVPPARPSCLPISPAILLSTTAQWRRLNLLKHCGSRSLMSTCTMATARRAFLRAPVLTVSIHADPVFFNPFVGYAHERGAGPGLGTNLNIPLPKGTGDDDYIKAIGEALKTIRAFAPGALVVALGLDASEHDPLAGLAVTTAGFRRIGAAIARLGLPTVFVQEGGYLSDILGANLTASLGGFEEAR